MCVYRHRRSREKALTTTRKEPDVKPIHRKTDSLTLEVLFILAVIAGVAALGYFLTVGAPL